MNRDDLTAALRQIEAHYPHTKGYPPQTVEAWLQDIGHLDACDLSAAVRWWCVDGGPDACGEPWPPASSSDLRRAIRYVSSARRADEDQRARREAAAVATAPSEWSVRVGILQDIVAKRMRWQDVASERTFDAEVHRRMSGACSTLNDAHGG